MEKYKLNSIQDFVEVFFEILPEFDYIPEACEEKYPMSYPCMMIVCDKDCTYDFIYLNDLQNDKQIKNMVEHQD